MVVVIFGWMRRRGCCSLWLVEVWKMGERGKVGIRLNDERGEVPVKGFHHVW